MNAATEPVEAGIRAAIDRLDFEGVRRTYQDQDQFIYLRDVFAPEVIAALRREALELGPRVVRNHVPLVRKGGFVGYQTLLAQDRTAARPAGGGSAIVSAYRSPALIDFLGRLAGKELFLKSEDDPHSCVLYYYNKMGDHLGYHYDTCGCERGASYTALLGLVDRSTQVLDCQLFKEDPARKTRRIQIKTTPGSLIAFNGSTVWHRVSRLGWREQRVVLSLSYRTERAMTSARRWTETVKDRLLFVGLRDFLPWTRR